MALGREIEKLITNQNLSLKSFAKKAGISYNTLYAIVKRDNETIKPEIMKKISAALNLPYDYFLQNISDNLFSDLIAHVDSLYDKDSSFNDISKEEWQFLFTLSHSLQLTTDELKKEKCQWATMQILNALSKLSLIGISEAVKRVEELTHIPPYCEYQNSDNQNLQEPPAIE